MEELKAGWAYQLALGFHQLCRRSTQWDIISVSRMEALYMIHAKSAGLRRLNPPPGLRRLSLSPETGQSARAFDKQQDITSLTNFTQGNHLEVRAISKL
jgi:hypothetical protein